jgi:hypothetical protein
MICLKKSADFSRFFLVFLSFFVLDVIMNVAFITVID